MNDKSRTPPENQLPVKPENLLPHGPLHWIAPNPDIVERFERIAPGYGKMLLEQWAIRNRRAWLTPFLSMIFSYTLALALIGGFIYLVMQGHAKAALGLLGAGAIGLVTAFLALAKDWSKTSST